MNGKAQSNLFSDETIRADSALESERLADGEVFIVKQGQLVKLAIDKDDTRSKFRVSADTAALAIEFQKKLRKLLRGHKPDINLVIEGLVLAGLNSGEAEEVTLDFCRSVFEKK